jgi:hypothetical protein
MEQVMGILDQAKKLGDKVSESVTTFSSDEVIANTIIKAVDKQEKVNALLLQKGSNYRVNNIELGMGIPPSVSFGVRCLSEYEQTHATDSSDVTNLADNLGD